MQPVRQPLGVAHQPGGLEVLAHAHQDALAGGPGTRNGLGLHLLEQLLVHPLGGAAERQLAQRREVGGREIVLERALGLLGNVDLALFQPLDQVVGREIHQLDGVGPVEDGIGHRLAYAHARDLGHYVVQALDVLDVDGGVDVDAVLEQLLDILVALGVAAAGNVGVRQLVDQDQARPPPNRGVDVELAQDTVDVDSRLARQDLEPLQQRLGLLAAVRLDHAGDDVHAFLALGPRRLQHLVGLADARCRADEDLEPTDVGASPPCRLQQGIRRGSLLGVASLIGHGSHAS